MVDYDPLPVVVDPEEALKDETLLFPGAGTNVAARTQPPAANADDLFDGCDVTVSGTLRQPAHGAVPARAALDRRGSSRTAG